MRTFLLKKQNIFCRLKIRPLICSSWMKRLNNLAAFDERLAKIVELKYFGGLTLDEIAEMLEISRTTVKRDWNIAKAWLKHHWNNTKVANRNEFVPKRVA